MPLNGPPEDDAHAEQNGDEEEDVGLIFDDGELIRRHSVERNKEEAYMVTCIIIFSLVPSHSPKGGESSA